LVVARILTAINVAIASPMLEWNAPLPPRRASSRARVRNQRLEPLGGHRQRAITRQPTRPALESGLQHAFDEQSPQTGTIDEQVPVDHLFPVRAHRPDDTRVRMLADRPDLALVTPHTHELRARP